MNTATAKGSMRFGYKMLLAFVVFALAATIAAISPSKAFADDPDYTTDITITGVKSGDTVTAYRIATPNIDANNNLTWDLRAGLPTGMTIDSISAVTSDGNFDYANPNSDAQQLAEELGLAIPATGAINSATDYQVTAGGSGAVFEGVDPGYYLVRVTTASAPTAVYQNMLIDVAPVVDGLNYKAHDPVTAAAKSSDDLTPTKTAAAKAAEGAALVYDQTKVTEYGLGEAVPFQVEATVPAYAVGTTYPTFRIYDEPTFGLQLNSSTVKVYDASGNEIDASNYTVEGGDADGARMGIIFDSTFILANPNADVTIQYTGTVMSTAFKNDDANTKNSAKVVFNNNPAKDWSEWANENPGKDPEDPADNPGDPSDPNDPGIGTTPPDEVDVITFGIQFPKVDKDDQPLAGAGFTLYKADADGKPTGTALGTDTSDANGNVVFAGLALAEGKYVAVETTVPAGKQKCENVVFDITEATATTDNPRTDGVTETNFATTADPIVDPDQGVLPITGGAGTLALTVGGVALIAAAIFVLRRNRQSAGC